jgi:threonine/homoserine/homoserine lactone efflux protein
MQFLTGFLLGLAVAASPGPIALLCIRRTLSRGWPEGVASGLGVATADAVYASLAAFGVAALTAVLVGGRFWLALAGGLALIVIGLRGALARPETEEASSPGRMGLIRAYVSTVGLTLANPQTILTFAAVFTSASSTFGQRVPALLVLGVLSGSASWWVILTGAAALARRRLNPRLLRTIRVVSGVLVVLFGIVTLVSATTHR